VPRRLPLLVLLAGALLAGFGRDARPAGPPVRLTVLEPADQAVVKADSVTLSGRVDPATAAVSVRGEQAEVSPRGRFHADVALAPGTNVIDVLASAGRACPARTATHTRRAVTVAVPDVAGLAPGDAAARLRARGLAPDLRDAGGLFDRILPGSAAVCATQPGAGEEVEPATTVTVLVAKAC
jgi:Glucodextranase, domain B/PASTA domain